MNEKRFYPMCLSVIYFHFISFILALSICFLIAFFEMSVMNLKTWRKHLCVNSKSPKMRSEKRKKKVLRNRAIQIYQTAAICSKAINEGNVSFYPDRGVSKLLCGYCRLLVFFFFFQEKQRFLIYTGNQKCEKKTEQVLQDELSNRFLKSQFLDTVTYQCWQMHKVELGRKTVYACRTWSKLDKPYPQWD